MGDQAREVGETPRDPGLAAGPRPNTPVHPARDGRRDGVLEAGVPSEFVRNGTGEVPSVPAVQEVPHALRRGANYGGGRGYNG